ECDEIVIGAPIRSHAAVTRPALSWQRAKAQSSERGACQPAIDHSAVPVNGHRRIGNRPSAHQHKQQAGGRARKGGIALTMTWLNCQTARVVPDPPLAAATKSAIGCVYVQASTGGQRLGPLGRVNVPAS